ncbi:lysostaphin resistance A-like protein [Pontibacter sp. 13R65]|uniref:CPBP family intramembrane glutamic endopeptidase n=1 Tax=Pontibacter sp. 13R65 TaxID=3127458 RepID=UPI00301CF947
MKGFILKETSPFLVLLLLMAFVLGGAFIATFVYAVLGELLFGVSLFELEKIFRNPAEITQGRDTVLFYQGIMAFCMFVLAPLLLLRSLHLEADYYLNWKNRSSLGLILLSGLLVIFIMPVNSLIIDWNAEISFPESMKAFEQWTRAKESEGAELIKMFVQFNSFTDFLISLVVMAVIAGVGEELIFRGVVQKQLQGWLGNQHAAIWLAAIAFSLIHVQLLRFCAPGGAGSAAGLSLLVVRAYYSAYFSALCEQRLSGAAVVLVPDRALKYRYSLKRADAFLLCSAVGADKCGHFILPAPAVYAGASA